jgi:hypothetical protein
MGGIAINQDDVEILARQMATEFCDKLKPAGTAADDDDLGLAAILAPAGHSASLLLHCNPSASADKSPDGASAG